MPKHPKIISLAARRKAAKTKKQKAAQLKKKTVPMHEFFWKTLKNYSPLQRRKVLRELTTLHEKEVAKGKKKTKRVA